MAKEPNAKKICCYFLNKFPRNSLVDLNRLIIISEANMVIYFNFKMHYGFLKEAREKSGDYKDFHFTHL